jgi:hypothetical protein
VLSQPISLGSRPSKSFLLLSKPRIKQEDVEMLDEDDAQTDRRLFRRRGSAMERDGPAKKRRTVNENDRPTGGKLNGFSLGLDYIDCETFPGVGWERVARVLLR